jgi:subtilase family serine protease
LSDSGDRLRLCSLALFASCLTMHAQTATPVRALLDTKPTLLDTKIDETQLVTLPGNTRSAALVLENDRGPVEDSLQLDHLLLLLQRPAATQAALDKLVDAMQAPESPEYHHWLKPQEFGSRFGVASYDTETVTNWLESHGMTVHRVYGNGLIDFSASAGQVREAFHTELHMLDVNGDPHISNVNDPMVPAALAPAIRGIVSLHDFRPHSLRATVVHSHVDVRTGQLLTASADNPEYAFTSRGESFQAVTPGDLATIYNLNPLFAAGYTGQGQTIAVIEDTNVYATGDWTAFRNTFGLAKYKTGAFTQVHPGSCANPGVNADDGEAILDAEYASASAPGATIELASCANTRTTFGGLLALAGLVNASTLPAVVSISYGECEAENGAAANATYSTLYQQAAAEGVSVFVASGDEGAAGCDNGAPAATHGINVNGFASTAYNVAVGGTDFGDTYAGDGSTYWSSTDSSTDASAKSYINEIPWNDSCAGALLASAATGSAAAYGANGFCNSATGRDYYLSTAASSGGPSSCFTGTAKSFGVSGGGSCKGNAKPSWQAGVLGIPSDGVRDLPDVSLFAANGLWGHYYIYCNSDKANGGAPCTGAPSGWSGAGGTSFAAPIMAGIQALVDQRAGARQGNPDAVYYKLAATEYGKTGSAVCNATKGNAVSSSCVFHDITQGDIDVNCTGSTSCFLPSGTNGVLSTASNANKSAYSTTPGFDLATGIGSVNAYNLVMTWPGVSGLLKTAKVSSGTK